MQMSILLGNQKKQKKSDATRARIKWAARAIFEAGGYGEVTVGKTVELANIAVGTFYIYYKNKSELLYDICVSYIDESVDEMKVSPLNPDRYTDIYSVIYANVKNTFENWQFYKSMLAYSIDNENFNLYLHEIRIEFGRHTINRLERFGPLAGSNSPDADRKGALNVAVALNCMVEAYMLDILRSMKPGEKPTQEELQQLAHFLAGIYFRGIFADVSTVTI
jgi:AcrR family transcriptional regulator